MKAAILFCLLGISFGYTIHRQEFITDISWHLWKGIHERSYNNIYEEKARYAIWKDNLRQITEFNQQNNGMTLGMNHFGDITNTEYRNMMTGYRMRNTTGGSTFLAASHVRVPETVDWRTEGYVTDIKNQGQCGSCWAFSTTGSLEGQHFKKTGKLVSLSEQNLVDCSTAEGNLGCQGGLMDDAFKYIQKNGGLDTEDSYPYTGTNGKCHYDPSKSGATVTGFVDVKSKDEDALKQAVATVGPVSVAIDASSLSFQFYSKGVYNPWFCSSTSLDHGVLAVGYGTLDGKDYWLVKNSWGEGWGQKGYIMMARNKNNKCGIATQASYPLV